MFSFEGWVLRLKEAWELITSQCLNFQVIKKKMIFSGFKSFSQSLESELTNDLCLLALNSLRFLVYTLPLRQEQPYHILRGQSVPCSNFSTCFPLQQKESAIRKEPADKQKLISIPGEESCLDWVPDWDMGGKKGKSWRAQGRDHLQADLISRLWTRSDSSHCFLFSLKKFTLALIT